MRTKRDDRNAARTAMFDQVNAAADDAASGLDTFARERGYLRTEGNLGQWPPLAAVVDKYWATLTELHLRGEPVLCPNLSFRAPQPANWRTYTRQVCCKACGDAHSARVRGTPEDGRCDACGADAGGKLWLISFVLPAIVVDIRPWSLTSMPPVTVGVGLCDQCHAECGLTRKSAR